MRMFSVRLSPLLRSSLDSLPSPEGMSFRLKLAKKPNLTVTEAYSLRSSQQTAWIWVSSCDPNNARCGDVPKYTDDSRLHFVT